MHKSNSKPKTNPDQLWRQQKQQQRTPRSTSAAASTRAVPTTTRDRTGGRGQAPAAGEEAYARAIAKMFERLGLLRCRQLAQAGRAALSFWVSSTSTGDPTSGSGSGELHLRQRESGHRVYLRRPDSLVGASCDCKAHTRPCCIHRARAYLQMQSWLETEAGWEWGCYWWATCCD